MSFRPKTAALYCVYGDDTWLPYSYQSIYPCVDSVYFFVSSKPWYGAPQDMTKLISTLRALPDPERKIYFEEGEWSEEKDQRNYSLALSAHDGMELGMIVDADEVYDSSQLSAAIQHVQSREDVSCWHMKWFTYWKSQHFRIDPLEPYDPPVFVRLGRGAFVETRNILADKHDLIPPEICICHHLSYARSDETLRSKHIFASGHSQSMRPGWYEEIWRGWDRDHTLTNLHPVTPEMYQRAVAQAPELLPPLLRNIP